MQFDAAVSINNLKRTGNIRDEREDIAELKDSIKEYGLKIPLLVSPNNDGTFDVVDGNRRCYACELLGIETIPVIFEEKIDGLNKSVTQMITNLQRKNLSLEEEGAAVFDIWEKTQSNYSVVSKLLGKDHFFVKSRLNYFQVRKFLSGTGLINTNILNTLTLQVAMEICKYPEAIWLKLAANTLGGKRWEKDLLERHCALLARDEKIKPLKKPYNTKKKKTYSRKYKDFAPEEEAPEEVPTIGEFQIYPPMGSRNDVKLVFRNKDSMKLALSYLRKMGGVIG